MLFASGVGATRAVIVDGKTFAFKRLLTDVHVGGRWSTVNPRLHYQIASGWAPRLEATDVQTNARIVIKDFAPLGYTASAQTSLFGGDGNQSVDDRIWMLQLRHATRGWEFVIWDKATDKVTGHIALSEQAGPGHAVDAWGVSPKGTFVTTASERAWTSNGVQVPDRLNVWSLSGQLLRSSPTHIGHMDLCTDTSGNEVLAWIASKYASNDKIAQTWRLDGAAGTSTVDQFLDGTIGWDFHISCASTLRPGYMTVSSYPSDTPQNYNRFPMWNHIFAVRLDGSKNVAVIANAHHSNTADPTNLYERSSFAVPNRDLTAVWFSASWDSSTAPVHSYVARPRAAPPGVTGLTGAYFANRSLTGQPALTRIDGTVDFSWAGAPSTGLPGNQFSVRWTGKIVAPSTGSYTFYTSSDDGVRLWVNNTLVVNNWTDHATAENAGTIALTAGQPVAIRLEYYDNYGNGVSRLSWSGPGIAKQIVPRVQLRPQ